jgi:hypothetical protein
MDFSAGVHSQYPPDQQMFKPLHLQEEELGQHSECLQRTEIPLLLTIAFIFFQIIS